MYLFGFLATDYELTLDRTNWQWGKKNINILMLAVVYKGIAIPVYWLLLNKKGNSNTKERIALLKRFIKRFGKTRIIRLLADREFIGKDWFTWLNLAGIDRTIRIKKNAKVSNSRGELVPAQQLFWYLKAGESQRLEGVRTMNSVDVYLSALRLQDGELLIVATGKADENAIESYARRWQIETLFSCLKSRGFNFEDTHVTDRRRIKRLLVVAVIAFCWAHRAVNGSMNRSTLSKSKNISGLPKVFSGLGLIGSTRRYLSLPIPLKMRLSCCFHFLRLISFVVQADFLSCTELKNIKLSQLKPHKSQTLNMYKSHPFQPLKRIAPKLPQKFKNRNNLRHKKNKKRKLKNLKPTTKNLKNATRLAVTKSA
jgi:hypothetical protein